MDQLKCASFFHTHYWYEVGMLKLPAAVCVCVLCVFFPFILGIKVVGRTSGGHTGGRSHRRKVTQEEGHTGFLIHLPFAVRALVFLARRIQPFLSLVDREAKFCVLTI